MKYNAGIMILDPDKPNKDLLKYLWRKLKCNQVFVYIYIYNIFKSQEN